LLSLGIVLLLLLLSLIPPSPTPAITFLWSPLPLLLSSLLCAGGVGTVVAVHALCSSSALSSFRVLAIFFPVFPSCAIVDFVVLLLPDLMADLYLFGLWFDFPLLYASCNLAGIISPYVPYNEF
jgi:hypothetical protein